MHIALNSTQTYNLLQDFSFMCIFVRGRTPIDASDMRSERLEYQCGNGQSDVYPASMASNLTHTPSPTTRGIKNRYAIYTHHKIGSNTIDVIVLGCVVHMGKEVMD